MIKGERVTLKKEIKNWHAVYGNGLLAPTQPIYPQFGVVYQVSGSTMHNGKLWISLFEIPSKFVFPAHRFRPVVSPKAEVSWTMGAPLDSEQFDNRKPAKVKA